MLSWEHSPSWDSSTLKYLSSETSRLALASFKTLCIHLITMSSFPQLDILMSALNADDPNHILGALPTGFGKTLPMLLLGHLLPKGASSQIVNPDAIQRRHRFHNNDPCAPHHHRAAVTWRLQEIGSYCHCWKPGEHLSFPDIEIQRLGFNLQSRFLSPTLRSCSPNALESFCAMLSFSLPRRWLNVFSLFSKYALSGQRRHSQQVALAQQSAANSLHRRESGNFLAIQVQ